MSLTRPWGKAGVEYDLWFEVVAKPQPKQRARSDPRHPHRPHYTPPETVAYEKLVAGCAHTASRFVIDGSRARPRNPPWPSSLQCQRARQRLRGERVTCACAWCASTWRVALLIVFPDHRTRDVDNVEKSILDAMRGILFADDCRAVVEAKDVAFNKVRPRVEVLVRRLDVQSVLALEE